MGKGPDVKRKGAVMRSPRGGFRCVFGGKRVVWACMLDVREKGKGKLVLRLGGLVVGLLG